MRSATSASMQPLVESSSEFLQHLGEVVRDRRRVAGLSMRELAMRADVSSRYLALLESGSGNISISRLRDIAIALGAPTSALLLDAERSRGAHAQHTNHAVRDTASAAVTATRSHRSLVALLGLRGAGKSTLGKLVARDLALRFVELDARVEERAGMSLAEIFELHGDDFYRRMEFEALRSLVDERSPCIVAASGGIVTDHGAFELLRSNALTVWLRARPEDHLRRVIAQGDPRPMSNRPDALRDIKQLLIARRALYEQADTVVNTSRLGLEGSVRAIVKYVRGSRVQT